jgi:hypothetical protein
LAIRRKLRFDEAPGKRTTDRGKIAEIWKKQADGNWKCIVDTWNSDLPAAARRRRPREARPMMSLTQSAAHRQFQPSNLN